jgi:CubicO group peptidase (beta-lactamase class C family)
MRDQPAGLEAEVAQTARELGVPGVAVGIDHGGKRETVTYGLTSVDHGQPVDEQTLFQIGSTAKTFTATAIMVLVEEGRVELDQPVRRYLPELQLRDERTAETLTVGQLLNHTAGWDGGDTWTDTGEGDDALERSVALLADLPQQFAAGTGASYNNAAFVVAGRVVEKVTGETYERALTRLVFDPLGLRQTLTSLNEIMTRPFAIGHRPGGSADGTVSVCRPWSDPRGYLPAGARLASSLSDQLTWARFQLGDGRSSDGTRLLSEHRLRAMHAPTTSHELLPGVQIGIGWLLREIDGVRLVEHHGDVSGQHSTVTVIPERDCAIVVLTNSSPTGREMAERIVRQTLETRGGGVERSPRRIGSVRGDLPHRGHRTAGRCRRRRTGHPRHRVRRRRSRRDAGVPGQPVGGRTVPRRRWSVRGPAGGIRPRIRRSCRGAARRSTGTARPNSILIPGVWRYATRPASGDEMCSGSAILKPPVELVRAGRIKHGGSE